MNDGNKEATKELLATFRAIFTAAVAILVLEVNLRLNGLLSVRVEWAFVASVVGFATVGVLCVVMFFIAIPMLHQEREEIVYDPILIIVGLLSIGMFMAAVGLLLLAQLAWWVS